MSQHSDEEVLIRKYLLGELDEPQQEQVEERLLCDDAFADRLYATQDNLIDDYVFDLLPEDDRERFETNFTLSNERRKKLLFAQTMESYVNLDEQRRLEAARPQPLWWENLLLFLRGHKVWSVTALAAVILLILLTPKIARWLRPTDQATASQNRAAIERRIAEVNKRPFDANIQAQPTLELTLQPTLLREGGEMKKAVLAGDIKNLGLKLVLPQVHYESYRAVVQTVEGSDLFAVEGLKPEPGAAEILLKIPSEFLPTNDYQIELKGIAADGHAEDVARYNLQIRR
jgi:hypothetical protein